MILNDFESGKLATLCYGINVATGLICKYSVDDKIDNADVVITNYPSK